MGAAAGKLLQDRLARACAVMPEVRLAVLFGSTARGTVSAGSDVDVAVLLSAPTSTVGGELELLLARVSGRNVDLIDLEQAPPLLRFEIAREGTLLLEREADAWVRFKAHAMRDWWEWAEIVRPLHAASLVRLKEKVTARGAC